MRDWRESRRGAGCKRQAAIVPEHERHVPSLALAFRIAKIFERVADFFY